MRHARLLICVLVLVLETSCLFGKRNAPPATPTMPAASSSPSRSGSPSELIDAAARSIFFLNASHGWAGGRGTIFATGDGGRSWRSARVGLGVVSSIEFVDRFRGWAVAATTLLRSSDGGATWKAIGRPPEPLESIHFSTRERGWGVTSAEHVFRSVDGGLSWHPVAFPSRVQSICFSGDQRGWAAGHRRIYATKDRGVSWHVSFRASTPRNLEADFDATVHCSGAGVWALFADGGASNQQSYFVVRSLNSGRTWAAVSQGAYVSILGPRKPELQDIGAYSGPFSVPKASVGVFMGRCYPCDPQPSWSVTVTNDGGKTWLAHKIPHTVTYWELSSVSFIDARLGWVVGGVSSGPGEIRSTRDGGRTWHVQLTSPLL